MILGEGSPGLKTGEDTVHRGHSPGWLATERKGSGDFLIRCCLKMKTLNGGESLPLSDLGCVLFSISCQAEHEEQTIADELEYENEKCRQPL